MNLSAPFQAISERFSQTLREKKQTSAFDTPPKVFFLFILFKKEQFVRQDDLLRSGDLPLTFM